MSGDETLLQYYVALDWAREIVADIDSGKAKFQTTRDRKARQDATMELREHHVQMIDILVDLIEANERRKYRRISGSAVQLV
jgi:hypothetical protein